MSAQTDKPEADALREFTTSLKIEQHKDRAVLTASLPLDLLKTLVTPHEGQHPSLDSNPARQTRTAPTSPSQAGQYDAMKLSAITLTVNHEQGEGSHHISGR